MNDFKRETEIGELRKRAKTAEREAAQALRTLKGLEKVARVVSEHSDEIYGENNALRADLEKYRKDAERYRWLREQEAEHGVSVVSISKWLSAATCVAVTFIDGSFVDHAIDVAMAKEQAE